MSNYCRYTTFKQEIIRDIAEFESQHSYTFLQALIRLKILEALNEELLLLEAKHIL